MKNYVVKFKRITTGYTEVFADNEDDSIRRLYNQEPFGEMLEIENEEFEFSDPEETTTNN